MAIKESPTHFEKVDQSTDPKCFIDFIDSRRMIKGERETKELILSQLDLRPGTHVLDIGCGTGDDAREIAGLVSPSGRVVGIDTSETMIAEARRRGVGCAPFLEFRTGDACSLDFPDASFDGVRTDRVLIFVRQTEKALAEAFRVLRHGGILVTSEIDLETQFIDSSMAELSRKFFARFAQENPQPRLGRELLRLVTQAGFSKVRSIAKVVQAPYSMFRRALDARLRSLDESGWPSHEEMARWTESLEQAEAEGVFNQGVIVFTVRGQKP
jgi:ubiquinone/menaquinone biosynthesis C-methylase UbiE